LLTSEGAGDRNVKYKMSMLKETLKISKTPEKKKGIKMINIAVELKYPGGPGQCFGSAMVSMRIQVPIQALIDQISKHVIYLPLGLHKGSTRRTLQPSKDNSTSKVEISSLFSIFVGKFALLDPDPADQCGSGSEMLVLC
jgi:hypothetical protein